MKNLLKFIAIVAFVVCTASTVSAQKMGHINLSELVTFMPESKKAAADLDTLQAQLVREIDKKQNELKIKYEAYKLDMSKGTMLPSIQKSREDELNTLQTALQTFQYQAQDDMDKKRNDLLTPIYTKAKDAVTAVAKEKGYTYVLDSSAGTVLFSADSDDLMGAVKTKLGLK